MYRIWIALLILVGCGQPLSRGQSWSIEVLPPDNIAKSSIRLERFMSAAGKLAVVIRRGSYVQCEHEFEFISDAVPSLAGCGLDAGDSRSYSVGVVLTERGTRRALAHARARIAPRDLPKQDRITLKLTLDVPVREFDPEKPAKN